MSPQSVPEPTKLLLLLIVSAVEDARLVTLTPLQMLPEMHALVKPRDSQLNVPALRDSQLTTDVKNVHLEWLETLTTPDNVLLTLAQL